MSVIKDTDPLLELRAHVDQQVRAFVWDQWAQLGIVADPHGGRDRWTTDPEALILLTLEAGRDEPRLFDELLDWMLVNERIVSVQRLRNLSADDDDRALVDAALGWVAALRPRARLASSPAAHSDARPEPLFRSGLPAPGEPDPAFLRAGFLRGLAQPRRHSRTPDLASPIAFAFRLRKVLGMSARAEVVRALLTIDVPRLPAQVIAASAGYTKRNVHEALAALHAGQVIDQLTIGNEQRYGIDRQRWTTLLSLAPDELPLHRDWPQLFAALRLLLRWLHDPVHEQQSDYLRASDARGLVDEIAPLLRFAGVRPSQDGSGADYWSAFTETVNATLATVA